MISCGWGEVCKTMEVGEWGVAKLNLSVGAKAP